MESVVVESIKSDVLQVSTPPPLVTPPHFHIIPENEIELRVSGNFGLNEVVCVFVCALNCDMLQKLKQLGPLKEEDQRLVVNLSQEGRRLVMDKKGMINFLKVTILLLILSCEVHFFVQNDERFGSYADYVCLKGEAERAKQLHENEVTSAS